MIKGNEWRIADLAIRLKKELLTPQEDLELQSYMAENAALARLIKIVAANKTLEAPNLITGYNPEMIDYKMVLRYSRRLVRRQDGDEIIDTILKDE